MLYGNPSSGYSYSPDRSKDVDRFNPSTSSNYRPRTSNPFNQSTWQQSYTSKESTGHYDGAGRWIKD